MVNSNYVPEKGDLVWLDFDPQTGHEQKGRRPAICISHKSYNQKIGLALFCPITSRIKGYPFEIVLNQHSINGCILSDQIKNLNWKQRNCDFIEKAADEEIDSVVQNIKLMIE
ncbi:endoribonuclease MazF [Treponema parvum]|uniref:Endoribonuclease MazF n=1 Tax=Treponema parvum TaxID=138851 RepID=A0A975F1B1_9SPIR|nr:endoribonuclease MazF [Treponema parvum]QTQ12606.1 endoribonuclease MazF [Treponema parvum]QTQ15409.1 endoribonuclease MazF [Treponema parvum]